MDFHWYQLLKNIFKWILKLKFLTGKFLTELSIVRILGGVLWSTNIFLKTSIFQKTTQRSHRNIKMNHFCWFEFEERTFILSSEKVKSLTEILANSHEFLTKLHEFISSDHSVVYQDHDPFRNRFCVEIFSNAPLAVFHVNATFTVLHFGSIQDPAFSEV